MECKNLLFLLDFAMLKKRVQGGEKDSSLKARFSILSNRTLSYRRTKLQTDLRFRF
jgi:hypothetical protein